MCSSRRYRARAEPCCITESGADVVERSRHRAAAASASDLEGLFGERTEAAPGHEKARQANLDGLWSVAGCSWSAFGDRFCALRLFLPPVLRRLPALVAAELRSRVSCREGLAALSASNRANRALVCKSACGVAGAGVFHRHAYNVVEAKAPALGLSQAPPCSVMAGAPVCPRAP